jgi:SAM-dependent methyltransferase
MTTPRLPERAEDVAFDAEYPAAIRAISRRFWTPVAVARRGAALLRRAGARTVLDVGSGVGKFVLVAAAETPDVQFVGVEQRAALVEVARELQARLGLSNARFEVGDVTEQAWHSFDGLYFFNPLEENLFTDGGQIDDSVELTQSRFFRDVRSFEGALQAAPMGMAIVTYHGTSGRMPACYELTEKEEAGSDWLRLWVKTRQDDGKFVFEVGDRVVVQPVRPAVA